MATATSRPPAPMASMPVEPQSGRTRAKPMASNWRNAMVPLVSVSRAWSTRSPISSPATALPETRWASMSLRVRFWRMLALVERDEGAAGVALVVGAGPDQAVVVVLLEQVGGPARDPRGRDHRGEEIHRDADRVEERRRVEVHVRDQPLGGLYLGVKLDRQLVPEGLARLPAGLLGHALEDRGAGIARGVDPVAEAHQAPLLAHRPVHERVDVVEPADLQQGAHHRLAGPAMQRALERADAARHRRVH